MKAETLSSISKLLNDGGRNYTIFLGRYEAKRGSGDSSVDLIRKMLGKEASVETIQEISTNKVLNEIAVSLMHEGDSGAGPDAAALKSVHFAELIERLILEVIEVANSASKIEVFRLSDGHPAYPVFWDFAFLFTRENDALAFIGSSSD